MRNPVLKIISPIEIMLNCHQELNIPDSQFINLLIITLGYPDKDTYFASYSYNWAALVFEYENTLVNLIRKGGTWHAHHNLADLNLFVNKEQIKNVENYFKF